PIAVDPDDEQPGDPTAQCGWCHQNAACAQAPDWLDQPQPRLQVATRNRPQPIQKHDSATCTYRLAAGRGSHSGIHQALHWEHDIADIAQIERGSTPDSV